MFAPGTLKTDIFCSEGVDVTFLHMRIKAQNPTLPNLTLFFLKMSVPFVLLGRSKLWRGKMTLKKESVSVEKYPFFLTCLTDPNADLASGGVRSRGDVYKGTTLAFVCRK